MPCRSCFRLDLRARSPPRAITVKHSRTGRQAGGRGGEGFSGFRGLGTETTGLRMGADLEREDALGPDVTKRNGIAHGNQRDSSIGNPDDTVNVIYTGFGRLWAAREESPPRIRERAIHCFIGAVNTSGN